MILVLTPTASADDIDHIVARINETGRRAHRSAGIGRTIIGVAGRDDPELRDTFAALPQVEACTG